MRGPFHEGVCKQARYDFDGVEYKFRRDLRMITQHSNLGQQNPGYASQDHMSFYHEM